MSKRRAEDTLEETTANSPLPKKSRVQPVDSPPPPPPADAAQHNNAHGASRSNGLQEHVATSPSNGIHGKRKIEAISGGSDGELNEEEEEDDDQDQPAGQPKSAIQGFSDLYLDTISRIRLDFDFEKVCSVTLVNFNVYACLVCGKYFSGRGPKTPAYFHALEEDHHVYINTETKKVYVLPDGYEVKSRSLDDIKTVVDPIFTLEDIKKLDKEFKQAWDLQGKKYNPGFVGLNNIKANDYLNVVVQALAHVAPLRNFFLLEDLSQRSQLAQRFSILVRKLWNARAFKSHVSPHELLQEIAMRSNKKYSLTQQSDPAEFLGWFLNNLHLALGGSKTKPQSSLIQKIFQGTMRVESQVITARADAGDRLRFEDAEVNSSTKPFTILTLDLPPAPLFQDSVEKNFIPQVPLTTVLSKYNGITSQERLNNRLRYRLQYPLPPYLIMHIKRFAANSFLPTQPGAGSSTGAGAAEQRNPTIVTFHPRALDMSPYVEPNPKIHPPAEPILYDLVANITYEGVRVRDDSVEGEAEKKEWKVQVRQGSIANGSDVEWWSLQDLRVEKLNVELLTIEESYVMIWERRKGGADGKGKGKA
jgi:U4/U6.U5 tri-snRNP-associated protein 2